MSEDRQNPFAGIGNISDVPWKGTEPGADIGRLRAQLLSMSRPLAIQRSVVLSVLGEPMPKGSYTRLPNGAVLNARRGPALKSYEAWVKALGVEAKCAMEERPPLDGALAIAATFYLRRPKNETRAERTRIWHTTPPDVDKLLRTVLDAIKGIAIADDARIAHGLIEKRYCPAGKLPGVELYISALKQGE